MMSNGTRRDWKTDPILYELASRFPPGTSSEVQRIALALITVKQRNESERTERPSGPMVDGLKAEIKAELCEELLTCLLRGR